LILPHTLLWVEFFMPFLGPNLCAALANQS